LEIKSSTIESFLKSFVFSFFLCLVWGGFTIVDAGNLLQRFDFTELLWLIYNVTISLLFLIRVKPALVSMNPVHWVIVLITSFSGFFFVRGDASNHSILLFTANFLILFALLLGIASAFTLGRSYDFLPALRHVKTKYLYQIIRHPMYLSSIIIKFGYVLKNPSIYNALLFIVLIVLYDKRAKYEEYVMSKDSSYVDYLRQVKYRFIPGAY
jgi:protein-S-isoprenylcysteine O-methyltransferase Ste14